MTIKVVILSTFRVSQPEVDLDSATSKMEYFVIIVSGFQPLTIITKCYILDVAVVLDPPLYYSFKP